jgi:hypothetical protein
MEHIHTTSLIIFGQLTDMATSVKFLLIVAAVFALGAVFIGCTFLKTSAPRTGQGVIRSKTGYGGGTYSQQQVGAQRGFRTASSIPIAPSYTFEIEVEGLAEKARCSLNTIAAEKFEVGQKVRVEYIVRGMKPFWSRVYVTSMEAVP